MRVLASDGAELECTLFGPEGGSRVLILSPSTTTADELRNSLCSTTPSLFREKLRCCVFDHRGTGRSSLHRDAQQLPSTSPPKPSLALLAEDARAVLDALHWESCLVLGISFGGMVALHLALAAPQLVERLLLVTSGASVGKQPGQCAPLHELLDGEAALQPEERCKRMLLLADSRRGEDFFAEETGEAALMYLMNNEAALSGSAALATGRRWQLEARAAHDVVARCGELKMPVAVLGALHDDIAPPAVGRSGTTWWT